MANKQDGREITVLYFAGASTAVGKAEERITLPRSIKEATDLFRLSQLAPLLVSLHPNTGLDKILDSSQWSVDAEMVDDPEQVVLQGGEEVAVIPPVSGG